MSKGLFHTLWGWLKTPEGAKRPDQAPEGPSIIDLLRPRLTIGVAILAVLNIAIFVVTHYWLKNASESRRWLALWPNTYPHIFVEVWRLFSFQFLHMSPTHICLNLFVIIQGGPILERHWGTLKFLVFYLLTAAAAAFCYELMIVAFDADFAGHYSRAAGASGGVYSITAAIVALYPKSRIGFLGLSVPFWMVLLIIVLINNCQIHNLHNAGKIIHCCAVFLGAAVALGVRHFRTVSPPAGGN